MNAAITALALATVLGIFPPESPAQAAGTDPIDVAAPCCTAEMAAAEALLISGKARAAHRMYHSIARRQLEAGDFPGDALWQAAEVSHYLGRYVQAARELDRVAAHARDFGRPNLEARALFEASYLYQAANRNDLAGTRLARVERLLASPEVGEETRAMIRGRLVG